MNTSTQQPHEQTHFVIKIEGAANGSLGDLADRFVPVEVASMEEESGRVLTTLTGMAADQARTIGGPAPCRLACPLVVKGMMRSRSRLGGRRRKEMETTPACGKPSA